VLRRMLVVILILSFDMPARAGFVALYFNRTTWEAAVDSFSTAPFTGFGPGTVITTQYAEIGANFVDGFYTVHFAGGFPSDGVGLDGNGDITVQFAQPMSHIGIDYPGFMEVELYSNGTLLYHSPLTGGAGAGFFLGVVSTIAFDRIVLIDFGDEAAIDNLSFGPAIPAPGALPLLALAAGLAPARRRRSCSRHWCGRSRRVG